MKTCYIVGAGEFYGSFMPDDDDLVIAADGGYKALLEKGIQCLETPTTFRPVLWDS